MQRTFLGEFGGSSLLKALEKKCKRFLVGRRHVACRAVNAAREGG